MAVAIPYWKVKVYVSVSDPKEVGKRNKGIRGVIDIVETKDTQSEIKYFVLAEKVT